MGPLTGSSTDIPDEWVSTPDLQPTLGDSEIALRPLLELDWQQLYSAAADPLIWVDHPARDRWQETEFRAFFESALASGGALAVIGQASDTIVGSTRFDLSRVKAGEIEIGWTFLCRAHWGGSTNAAMKRLMIAHALRYFDRAIFMVGTDNVRSQRAMERIGGRLTDRQEISSIAGQQILHLVYVIDRAAFVDGPLQRRLA
jgi:RimJ/RimL family protein N-acetyltransferase